MPILAKTAYLAKITRDLEYYNSFARKHFYAFIKLFLQYVSIIYCEPLKASPYFTITSTKTLPHTGRQPAPLCLAPLRREFPEEKTAPIWHESWSERLYSQPLSWAQVHTGNSATPADWWKHLSRRGVQTFLENTMTFPNTDPSTSRSCFQVNPFFFWPSPFLIPLLKLGLMSQLNNLSHCITWVKSPTASVQISLPPFASFMAWLNYLIQLYFLHCGDRTAVLTVPASYGCYETWVGGDCKARGTIPGIGQGFTMLLLSWPLSLSSSSSSSS